MTTSSESIPNKALSGSEIKQLIMADCSRLIANDSLLADHLAYGRISYEVRITKHIDNQFIPTDVSIISSLPVGTNLLKAMPEMESVERFPLDSPSDQAMIDSQEVHRDITRPNAERLRMGLPVPADIRQPDGTVITEQIKYPATNEEGDVTFKDVSEEAHAEVANKPKVRTAS